MEVSAKKSKIVTPYEPLSKLIADKVEGNKAKASRLGKLLGAGTVGGKRRTTSILDDRVKKFRLKKHRVRQLGRHGLSQQHAARAVGMPSVSYSAELTGFSDSTLTAVRRDVAFAATPSTAGGHFEHALLAIDGARGRLDPAFNVGRERFTTSGSTRRR